MYQQPEQLMLRVYCIAIPAHHAQNKNDTGKEQAHSLRIINRQMWSGKTDRGQNN
ncbi:MAG: hypothetical protein MZV63_03775 [Marinilabiliales bacterium]|nr:hypothetical protein [Marinilabiliales bacterium]